MNGQNLRSLVLAKSPFRCDLITMALGVPKNTLRFPGWLEGLTELRKAVMLKAAVYHRKRCSQVSYRKRHEGQKPGEPGASFQVPPPCRTLHAVPPPGGITNQAGSRACCTGLFWRGSHEGLDLL